MERAKKRIAIIGGGLRGLVTAYEINKAILDEQLPFEFIIIERRNSPGGMIKTYQTEDGPVDVGSSSFDIRRGDFRPFLEELGLGDQIQYSIGGKLDRYSNHTFMTLDKPTYQGIPLKRTDIIYDPELAWTDKLAVLAGSPFPKKDKGNKLAQTAKEFLDEHFCEELTNRVAYPYYSENIFGSLDLCSPSLIDPNLVKLFAPEKATKMLNAKERIELQDGMGTEYTLVGGMATLVNRLLESVGDSVETGQTLTDLARLEQGILKISLNNKEDIRVGSVISTLSISDLYTVSTETNRGKRLIPKTSNASMATILFQFPKGVIKNYPTGFGFVIPKRSSFHITKGTFLNKKWQSFADATYDNLLIEVGRRQDEVLVSLPDEVILTMIKEELKEILDLQGTYHFAQVNRWQHAVPHLSIEHRAEMELNDARFKDSFYSRGVFIGGNGYEGYGMHNAIKEGKNLAQEAIAYMKRKNNIE